MSDEYTMQENNQQTVDYSDDNIKTLTGTEHIRLRPGMYIGRLGLRAAEGSHRQLDRRV